jgi:hypothetical protein
MQTRAELGVREAGTAAAEHSAAFVADAFRFVGIEPRFHEFNLVGYDADEPELEIDGERWAAGPCPYANPTDGTVEGRVRRIGSHSLGGIYPVADIFAVEDRAAASSRGCI